MIRKSIFVLALLLTQLLNAQGWTYLQGFPLQNSSDRGTLNSIEKVPGNGYVLSGNVRLSGQPTRPLFVRLDEYGTPILVRSYTYDSTSFHQTVPTSDGGFLTHAQFSNDFASSDLLGIHKLNAQGDSIWSYNYGDSRSRPDPSEDLLFESPNGDCAALFHTQDTLDPFLWYPRLVLLNSQGVLLRDTTLYNLPSNTLHRSCQGVDGSFFLSTVFTNTTDGSEQRMLRRIDATGQLLWQRFTSPPYMPADSIPRHNFCAPTPDTGLVVIYELLSPTPPSNATNRVVRYDSQGNEVWSYVLPTPDLSYPAELHVDSVGVLAMTSEFNNAKIWDLDPQGGFRSMSIVSPMPGLLSGDSTSSYYLWNLLRADDGYLVVSGDLSDGTQRPLAMKLDTNNSFVANSIGGQLFKDDSNDCTLQANETRLRDWLIWVNGSPATFTDSTGSFQEYIGAGNHAIAATSPGNIWSDLWEFNCPSNPDLHLVNFTTNQADTLDTLDFAVVPLVECPLLYVDMGSPYLVRCEPANYHVHYCNYGTIAADSAFILVQLDSSLSFTGASIPFSLDSANSLIRFDLGTVAVGECGDFILNADVFCDSLNPGRVHCSSAHIYPDSLCNSPNPNWSGASLQVTGLCANDSVRFTVSNVGNANMVSGTGVWVVEDDILRYSGTVQLNMGQDTSLVYPANGSTWATLVQQVPFHPGPSIPRAIIEGCGTDSSGLFSLGFAAQFAEDDLPPYISIDCQEDLASLDPNDKRGFPLGVGAQHEIFGSDELEYTIRFQNTGNDTARKVILRDRIPSTLNLGSIVMGASSHPYTLEIRDGNLVEWTFDPIVLPDSVSNPLGSQGFVRFSILQNPTNQVGTRIENEVAIYFDYNAPVITAPAWHTIRGPYEMVPTSTEPTRHGAPKVTAFPNPFSESVTFRLEQVKGKAIRFELFDLSGKMVRSLQQNNTGQFEVERNGLPAGMYLYRIFVDGNRVDSGKILVQSR